MKTKLHQLQVAYLPVEDRMLLRINTTDRAEYRLWLTRRFVSIIWPKLLEILGMDPEIGQQMTDVARKAMLAFAHEKAVSGADFDSSYVEEDVVHPLGNDPMLISRLDVGKSDEGIYKFTLSPSAGRGVVLNMDMRLIHSFCRLLMEASKKSGWGLNLDIADMLLSPPQRVKHSIN